MSGPERRDVQEERPVKLTDLLGRLALAEDVLTLSDPVYLRDALQRIGEAKRNLEDRMIALKLEEARAVDRAYTALEASKQTPPSNDKARDRFAIEAIALDAKVQDARADVREAERLLTGAEAAVAAYRDARGASRESAIRQLAIALDSSSPLSIVDDIVHTGLAS